MKNRKYFKDLIGYVLATVMMVNLSIDTVLAQQTGDQEPYPVSVPANLPS